MNSPIELDEGCPLSEDEANRVEEELLNLLAFEGAGLDDKLIAGAVLLDILRDSLNAIIETSRPDLINTFFDWMKEERYARPLRIARKPIHSPSLQRMLLGLLIAFRNHPEKRRSNLGALAFIALQHARHFLKLGKIHIQPLSTPFPYHAFKQYPINTGADFFTHKVGVWAEQFIRNKKPRHGKSLRQGYGHMLLYYAMIHWYAVGLAWEKKATVVGPEEVAKAIALTEEYYIFNPAFEEIFTYNPVVRDMLEKTLNRRSTAASLVRKPI